MEAGAGSVGCNHAVHQLQILASKCDPTAAVSQSRLMACQQALCYYIPDLYYCRHQVVSGRGCPGRPAHDRFLCCFGTRFTNTTVAMLLAFPNFMVQRASFSLHQYSQIGGRAWQCSLPAPQHSTQVASQCLSCSSCGSQSPDPQAGAHLCSTMVCCCIPSTDVALFLSKL